MLALDRLVGQIGMWSQDREFQIKHVLTRAVAPSLILLESAIVVTAIVQLPFESVAKIFTAVAARCCHKCCGKGDDYKRGLHASGHVTPNYRIVIWDEKLNPWDTIKKIMTVFALVWFSLFFSWSLPALNLRIHEHIEAMTSQRSRASVYSNNSESGFNTVSKSKSEFNLNDSDDD